MSESIYNTVTKNYDIYDEIIKIPINLLGENFGYQVIGYKDNASHYLDTDGSVQFVFPDVPILTKDRDLPRYKHLKESKKIEKKDTQLDIYDLYLNNL